MAYTLVVFDWDGTLMDSTHDIVVAIQSASRDLGLPVPTREQARWVIGLPLGPALARAVPALTPELQPQFVARYRQHYLTRDPQRRLFDGIAPLLEELRRRHVQLAVATGASRVGLNRALAATGLTQHFAATRCADETHGKPHPAMLLELMDELQVDAQELIMVGDTTHDLQMAKNAGVDSLAVSYGAHTEAELLTGTPQAVAHDVAALRAWLLARVRRRMVIGIHSP